jgi:DNA-binding HxlR family transcriptional regulator
MVLFDTLGRRWTLRILWELRTERLNFRALRGQCAEISPTVLNQRLKELRDLDLVDHTELGYGLTDWGRALGEELLALSDFANRWDAGRSHSREP